MNDMTSMEEFVSPELLEEMFGFSSIISLISAIPGLLFSVAVYIATSYALYTIANRRGIKNPWLAWIPVVNLWTLGAIADDYRIRAHGKKTSRRKVLLGTQIAQTVLAPLVVVLCIVILVTFFSDVEAGSTGISEDAAVTIGISAIAVLLLGLPLVVVAVIRLIFYYIAYYELFKSCDPDSAVLYLVLSIFFGILLPVFLFLCRNKDEGMPRPQPEIPPVSWEPPAPAAEPWNDPTQL